MNTTDPGRIDRGNRPNEGRHRLHSPNAQASRRRPLDHHQHAVFVDVFRHSVSPPGRAFCLAFGNDLIRQRVDLFGELLR
jgi:hypothetical protein